MLQELVIWLTALVRQFAIIEKKRPEPGVAKVMNLIGDVKGKNCIIVDDIVDTAGSLVEGAKALEEFGAKSVTAAPPPPLPPPLMPPPSINRSC